MSIKACDGTNAEAFKKFDDPVRGVTLATVPKSRGRTPLVHQDTRGAASSVVGRVSRKASWAASLTMSASRAQGTSLPVRPSSVPRSKPGRASGISSRFHGPSQRAKSPESTGSAITELKTETDSLRKALSKAEDKQEQTAVELVQARNEQMSAIQALSEWQNHAEDLKSQCAVLMCEAPSMRDELSAACLEAEEANRAASLAISTYNKGRLRPARPPMRTNDVDLPRRKTALEVGGVARPERTASGSFTPAGKSKARKSLADIKAEKGMHYLRAVEQAAQNAESPAMDSIQRLTLDQISTNTRNQTSAVKKFAEFETLNESALKKHIAFLVAHDPSYDVILPAATHDLSQGMKPWKVLGKMCAGLKISRADLSTQLAKIEAGYDNKLAGYAAVINDAEALDYPEVPGFIIEQLDVGDVEGSEEEPQDGDDAASSEYGEDYYSG